MRGIPLTHRDDSKLVFWHALNGHISWTQAEIYTAERYDDQKVKVNKIDQNAGVLLSKFEGIATPKQKMTIIKHIWKPHRNSSDPRKSVNAEDC